MATLYGGDILALVCSTWNISDASERPAYLGAIPITSGARHRTHPRTPATRHEPRHETPGRGVADSDPAAPRTGLQPAATTYTRRPPPPAIWRPTAFPPNIATLGVFRVETNSGSRWRRWFVRSGDCAA